MAKGVNDRKSTKPEDSTSESSDASAASENDEFEHSSDSEEESEDDEEDEDLTAIFKGANVPSRDKTAEGSGSDDSSDSSSPTQPKSVKRLEHCTFDLRNMMSVNSHQIQASSLYSSKKPSQPERSITIPLDCGHGLDLDEDFLLRTASSSCRQLVAALWELPTERSDAGPLVSLPSYDEIRLPRALPPPPPKQETKWEAFAKAKGIPLNKEKRSRKIWDEATGTWMYRHGYEKANSKSKEWPIMEVGANEDPFDDPWEKLHDEKRARVEKNISNRLKNEEHAGKLNKGASNRVMKDFERSRKANMIRGKKDHGMPSGLPVDLACTSDKATKRGKDNTVSALKAVQRSTASLGKFDELREGEPQKQKTLAKLKKRKFESSTDKKVLSKEGEKSMKILKTVIGGASRERDIRKGKLAKGETAYDYDYDDGLGASSFKKKKGRAGAGKVKKLTKKRAK